MVKKLNSCIPRHVWKELIKDKKFVKIQNKRRKKLGLKPLKKC